jgi:lipoate-protein ligase A
MGRELRIIFAERPEDPYMNLSIEEAVFIERCNNSVPDTLRFWRNQNAVVIGVFQRASEEVDLDYASKMGIKVVRRFTSGGAVYHDLGNLNFALSTMVKSRKGVDYLYGELLEGVMNGLRRLGLNPYKENVNDIVVNDRKVIGVAGSIRKNCVFLHGAVLINTDLNILARVLKVSRKKLLDKKFKSVKYRVTNLKNINTNIETRDVIKALTTGFEETLDSVSYPDLITQKEIETANQLYKRKYTRKEWNMERARPNMEW